MSTYKTTDLLRVAGEMVDEGYDFAEISVLEADDEFPESISFDVVLSQSSEMNFDEIESVNIPDDYDMDFYEQEASFDDVSRTLTFSSKELNALMNAVNITLDCVKDNLSIKTIDRSAKETLKSFSVDLRNLQAKFAKFRKKYGITST